MSRCAKCGACTVVCPIFRQTGREGHSARGRLHLKETLPDSASPLAKELSASCLLCGACAATCPRGIDTRSAIIKTRAAFSPMAGPGGYKKLLARQLLSSPLVHSPLARLGRSAASLQSLLPRDSGLRLRLGLFDPGTSVGLGRPGPGGARDAGGSAMLLYPGCAGQHLWPEMISACRDLVDRAGSALELPAGLGCCGLAAHSAGDLAEARRLARRVIESLAGDGPVLVACASCYAQLSEYPQLLAHDPAWADRARALAERLVELSRFLAPSLAVVGDREGQERRRVLYHDPCHFRYQVKISREPRRLLRACPGLELVELADGPGCCGLGGLFHLARPDLSRRIGHGLLERALAQDIEVVTSTCSGCLMQWRMAVAAAGARIEVLHLATLLRRELMSKEDSGLPRD